MLTLDSDAEEFEARLEEISDRRELKDLYDRVKYIRDSLWDDYMQITTTSIRKEVRKEYEDFKQLTRKVRRQLFSTTVS